MLISVIIPTYKNRGGLRDSIISVLNQSYEPIEIIVVDDNSPESDARKNTEAVMREFKGNKRIIYLRHPENRNGAAARNTGIKASKGDYIAFLDDDDIFLPGKIQKQKNYLDCHIEYAATYCLAQRGGKRLNTYPYKGNLARELLLMKTSMFTPTLMFRREALDAINGFDESFRRHQDYELLLRFFRQGYKMGCVDEILTEIGTNDGENALSADKLFQMKKNYLKMFADEIAYYEKRTPGFKNYVYGKHITALFMAYLKEHRIGMATKMVLKAFSYSPKAFWEGVYYSVIYHIKR